jgi:hypothetical protein
MPPAGFESAIQASERRQTHALTARPLGSAALFPIDKIFLMFYMGNFPLFEVVRSVGKLYPFRRVRISRSRLIRDPVFYLLPVCSQFPQTTLV